jgi:DNA-binding LytR/AlgR family response regulator
MNVVIIEDEKMNAEIIQTHIRKTALDINIAAVLPANQDVREWFTGNSQPDLVFCDIELLDGNIFDKLREDVIQCPIIFTTAYDSYYQEAFDQNGIAYLLKPISFKKFKNAIDKFRRLQGHAEKQNWQVLYKAVQKLQASYKERIIVRSGGAMQMLHVEDVVCFIARDGKCIAHTESGSNYEFRYTLSELADELDPDQFFQINRGEIVNINYIQQFESFSSARLSLKMKNIDQRLIVSSASTPAFRQWAEKS